MKVIGENEVKIQLKSSTGPMGPAGADGKDGTSVTHSWNGTTLTVTSASGTSSADLKGEKGEPGKDGKDGATGLVGPAGADGKDGAPGADGEDGGYYSPSVDAEGNLTWMPSKTGMPGVAGANIRGPEGQKGATGPAGANGKDYVLTEADKQEIAGMVEVPGGVGAAIDDTTPSTTTTYSSQKIEDELSALNEANATQDTEIAKKANDADLAKVAKSGSYNDLSNKPTIPAAYTLPIANATTLGGVMPAAKTDEMTQAVGVDDAGGLWTSAGGGEDWVTLGDFTLNEEVSTVTINWTNEKYPFTNGRVYLIQNTLVGAEGATEEFNVNQLGVWPNLGTDNGSLFGSGIYKTPIAGSNRNFMEVVYAFRQHETSNNVLSYLYYMVDFNYPGNKVGKAYIDRAQGIMFSTSGIFGVGSRFKVLMKDL